MCRIYLSGLFLWMCVCVCVFNVSVRFQQSMFPRRQGRFVHFVLFEKPDQSVWLYGSAAMPSTATASSTHRQLCLDMTSDSASFVFHNHVFDTNIIPVFHFSWFHRLLSVTYVFCDLTVQNMHRLVACLLIPNVLCRTGIFWSCAYEFVVSVRHEVSWSNNLT